MHELITQSCTEKTGGDVGDEEARPTYTWIFNHTRTRGFLFPREQWHSGESTGVY